MTRSELVTTSSIPVAEQVDALLHGRVSELATKYCGGDASSLINFWTVTPNDFADAIRQDGLPVGWFHTSHATFDGIYLLECNSAWIVYEQERGHIYTESRRTFETYESAIDYLIRTQFMPTRDTN